jgi:hypothetical protein
MLESRIPDPGSGAVTAEGNFEVIEGKSVVQWVLPPNTSLERSRER